MEKDEIKRMLAGMGIASLMAGAGIALTAQPAMSAWSGAKKGAVSTPVVEQAPVLTINAKPVKNIHELQAALDTIAPGTDVKMVFKSNGKELVLEGSAKQSQ